MRPSPELVHDVFCLSKRDINTMESQNDPWKLFYHSPFQSQKNTCTKTPVIERTSSERTSRRWAADLGTKVVWRKNEFKLAGICCGESNLFCLIITKSLASPLIKALYLDREYQGSKTQAKEFGQHNESKRNDGKVLLKSHRFGIELKKSEIK